VNETEENFWKAWAEPVPEPAPVFFRLYYDEHGRPLSYSMENRPGNYIDIDRETFVDFPKYVRVVDGKLELLQVHHVCKLVPGKSGTPCASTDVSVVVSSEQQHVKWSLK
jgi:hypothetical protein